MAFSRSTRHLSLYRHPGDLHTAEIGLAEDRAGALNHVPELHRFRSARPNAHHDRLGPDSPVSRDAQSILQRALKPSHRRSPISIHHSWYDPERHLFSLSDGVAIGQRVKKRHRHGNQNTHCHHHFWPCLLYTSPSPRDVEESRMPSSA